MTKNQRELVVEWAGEFDVLFGKYPQEYVFAVFDDYTAQWRKSRDHREVEWVCYTPKTFIGQFVHYERSYLWNRRPISESELMGILGPLRRERWEGDWESVVTAVSQSLANVRQFCAGLDRAQMPDDVKRWIRGMIGTMSVYVKNHFSKWRVNQTTAVWKATITMETLFAAAHAQLMRAGYSMGYAQRCLYKLRSVVEKEMEPCLI